MAHTMKLNNDVLEYLTDTKFSNGKKFLFKEKNETSITSRQELLTNLSKNKNVIHLGACDHIPLILKKIGENQWLHKLLTDSAKNIIGIDINHDAVEYCNNLGYDNIYCYDMITDADAIISKIKTIVDNDNNQKIDYIIAGEIVEHLEDPINFLKQINNIYADYVECIIVTVPNILNYRYLSYAMKSIECINTDHKYWFTPYTISKVLTIAGMKVNEIMFVGNRKSIIQRVINCTLKNKLIISDSLICIAYLQN